MKTLSLVHSSKSNSVSACYSYTHAIEKQRASEIGKELKKGYMKLLSNFNN